MQGQELMPKPTAILMIVENLPVPFDRRMWQQARALAEAGFQVSMICPKGPGCEKSRETIEGIKIYRHRIWEASTRLGYFLEYSWALAAEFVLALRIFARERFKILHAANPPDTIFLIGIFFKMFGVRFIYDHHDLNPELYEAKFGTRGVLHWLVCHAEKWSFRTANISIATNESYREIATARGDMKPNCVLVVRSCPDLKNVRLGAPQPALKDGGRNLVVYLGVMGPQEGLDLLLESIVWIVSEKGRKDIRFALIGGGTELSRLKNLVTEKGLDAMVKFTGRIPDDDLAEYLSTADVCVAPDPKNPMNDKSTMNKILEYMAYGRPVVLFDLTEGRCSAEDAALYARPNDPVDYAGKILTLLDSEQLRRELGARGRKRIEEQLNWENEKQSLLTAYELALK
jgi:glycosyltransferase involved in cell wall biosynthesis